MKAFAWLVFVVVLVPIAWWRRLTGVSRFGTRLHRSASAWDLGVVPARVEAARRPAAERRMG